VTRKASEPIVSDAPNRSPWPWLRRWLRAGEAPEVSLGRPLETADQPAARPAEKTPRRKHVTASGGVLRPPAPAWVLILGLPLIGFFALFHAAPRLADFFGEPRLLLHGLLDGAPFGETLARAAAAWLWQPVWLWVGALGLRVRALQRLRRDAPGAAMMALIAVAAETGFWIFMGLKQTGAYSPEEQAALILMLKIEGGLMFVFLCLATPTGFRKLGETDAHWNRD
jgi:hypothetical protein